jgi:hypothetical protein
MNNELKGAERKRSWHNLRYYPSISLEGLRKTTNLGEDRLSLGCLPLDRKVLWSWMLEESQEKAQGACSLAGIRTSAASNAGLLRYRCPLQLGAIDIIVHFLNEEMHRTPELLYTVIVYGVLPARRRAHTHTIATSWPISMLRFQEEEMQGFPRSNTSLWVKQLSRTYGPCSFQFILWSDISVSSHTLLCGEVATQPTVLKCWWRTSGRNQGVSAHRTPYLSAVQFQEG